MSWLNDWGDPDDGRRIGEALELGDPELEPRPYCKYGHYEEHDRLPQCIDELLAGTPDDDTALRYVILHPQGSIYATTASLEIANREAKRLGGTHLQVTDL